MSQKARGSDAILLHEARSCQLRTTVVAQGHLDPPDLKRAEDSPKVLVVGRQGTPDRHLGVTFKVESLRLLGS